MTWTAFIVLAATLLFIAPSLEGGELRIETIGAAVVDGDPLAIVLMREIGMRIGFVLAGSISFCSRFSASANSSDARFRAKSVPASC